MKKVLIFALTAAGILISCNKGTQDPAQEINFEISGNYFETLQGALNSIASDQGTAMKTVKLLKDISGDGAAVEANCIFKLDLNGHTYTLNDGKGICVGDGAGMYLGGESGKLAAPSSEPAVTLGNGFLYIYEGVSLEAQKAIDAGSEVYVGEDFCGRISGGVKLQDCYMKIGSVGSGIEISALEVNSEEKGGAALVCSQASGTVSVFRVVSNQDYPVWADVEGAAVIGSGASLHVHSYGAEVTHEATCCTEKYVSKTCPVCGHIHNEYESWDGELGPCSAEDLVHVEAVEVLPPLAGCVEHWICPHCGRAYADAEGKVLLENGPQVLADNFLLDSDLLHACDDVFSWEYDEEDTKAAGGVIAGIVASVVISAITTGITESSSSSSTDRILDKLDDISGKMDEMNTTLKSISAELSELDSKLSTINNKVDEVIDKMTRLIENYESDKFKATAKEYRERRKSVVSVGKEGTETFADFNELAQAYLKKQTETDSIEIVKTLEYWGKNYADKTLQLLEDFKANSNNVSYLGCVYDYASNVYPWEHESYDFLYQSIAEFILKITPAYVMTCQYYKFDSSLPARTIKRKVEELTTLYKYSKQVLDAMQPAATERNKAYSRCNISSIAAGVSRTTYYRAAVQKDGWDFIKFLNRGYKFPSNADKAVAVTTCKKWEEEFMPSADKYLTGEVFDLYYRYYVAGVKNGERTPSSYNVASGSLRPNYFDKQSNTIFYGPSSDKTFKLLNGSNLKPSCGMVNWTIDYYPYENGYFAINTAYAVKMPSVLGSRFSPKDEYATKYTARLTYRSGISAAGTYSVGEIAEDNYSNWLAIKICQNDKGYENTVLANIKEE